jgi:CRISPR-associated endonuclease/helicase Cas3
MAGAARAVAWQNLLTFQDGYAQGSGAWASDVHTPTRLAEPGLTYRIGIWRGGQIELCCTYGDKSWAMSEINLPSWRVKDVPPETGMRADAILALRKGWGRWEQEIPVLLLDANATGTVLDRKNLPITVRYSRETGMVFDRAPASVPLP